MIGNVSSNFVNIAIIGDRVKAGIRNGKIALSLNMVAYLNKYGSKHEKRKKQRANMHPIFQTQTFQS